MTRMLPTTEFVQPVIPDPLTLRELLSTSAASRAGYSAVSKWLGCPEQARLGSIGVKRKPDNNANPLALSDLDIGTVAHALRAIRFYYRDHDRAMASLSRWSSEMLEEQFMKLRLIFATYENQFPLASEPLEILGIEAEVRSELGQALDGRAIVRSVRYDTVVRSGTDVFSFECKTMARSGMGSIAPYTPQAMSQVAIWNANPALVEQYGPMRGIIFDCLVKTIVPHVERIGPLYFGKVHSKLAREYLCSPETQVEFKVGPDGKYPKMLHACWGRYRPCDYLALCHEEAYGDYQFRDGREYNGE